MVIWRRFLVLTALGSWQGGFAFYAAVVVPMGEQVLSSPIEQGFVTRRVTNYLNVAGLVALPLLFWDMRAGERKIRLRLFAWAAMAIILAMQIWLHARLDQRLDPASFSVKDQSRFELEHGIYVPISYLQWFCSLAFLACTLKEWKARNSP